MAQRKKFKVVDSQDMCCLSTGNADYFAPDGKPLRVSNLEDQYIKEWGHVPEDRRGSFVQWVYNKAKAGKLTIRGRYEEHKADCLTQSIYQTLTTLDPDTLVASSVNVTALSATMSAEAVDKCRGMAQDLADLGLNFDLFLEEDE